MLVCKRCRADARAGFRPSHMMLAQAALRSILPCVTLVHEYDTYAGGSGGSPDSGQPLPPDAIAALLAIDSLPLPEELDPGLTTGQPYMGSYL